MDLLDSLLLFSVLLLMLMNWGFEAIKWKTLFSNTIKISFGEAFKAVLSGLSFAHATPNRVGEFLGRVWHLPEHHRIAGGSYTFVAGIAQWIITLIMGWGAVLYMILVPYEGQTHIFQVVLWPLFVFMPCVILCISLMYFQSGKMLIWFSGVKWLARYAEKLKLAAKLNRRILCRVLVHSFFRYIVFVLQYWVIFRLCKVDMSFGDLCIILSFLFLVLSAVPSIALLELGLRWDLGIRLFGLISTQVMGISLSMLLIWGINLILPALVGSFFLLPKNQKNIVETEREF